MSGDSSNPTAQSGAVADLKLVETADEATDFEAAPSPGEEDRDTREGPDEANADEGDASSGRGGLPIWLFVVVVVLAVVVMGWQAQRAGELEAQVTLLEADLARTNAVLDAHRSHLGEIQDGVEDVTDRLLGLRALVEAGPTDPVTPIDTRPDTP